MSPNAVKIPDREELLLKIIETIRSSLDIKETLSIICREIQETFNSERVSLIQFTNINNFAEWELRHESKIRPDIIAINDIDFNRNIGLFWGDILLNEGVSFSLENIPEADIPEMLKVTYRQMGLKTLLGIPIIKDNDFWGGLFLSEYDYSRHWEENEIRLLEAISSQIYMAIKQAELFEEKKKHIEREWVHRKIIETIRNSFAIRKITSDLVTEVGKAFNADMCFILQYDPVKEEFLPVDENAEYRSSSDVKSIIGYDPKSPSVKLFIEAFKRIKEVNYLDVEKFIVEKNLKGTDAERFLREYNIKSSYNIAIFHANQLLGFIILEYTKNYCELDEDDLEFLRDLATQAGIAIYQSKLYFKTLNQAERELLLRKITESIRNSLDLKEVKNKIVEEVCRTFKADRCFIRFYDNNEFLPADCEYSLNEDLRGFKGISFPKEVDAYLKELHKQHKPNALPDIANIPEDTPINIAMKRLFTEFNIKSGYAIPIFCTNKLIGVFILQYITSKVCLSAEEMELLETIAGQAGMAIKQAELFEENKKQAEREALLRKITEIIRNSLDINRVKNNIVNEVGKAFNADRCFMRIYDDIKFPVTEYMSNAKSLIDYKFDDRFNKYVISTHKKGKSIIIPDVDRMPENPLHNSVMLEFCINQNLKSNYGFPIFANNQLIGSLVIQYVREKNELDDDDLQLLKQIADQAGMAIIQARLFESVRQAAEREELLRKIATTIKNKNTQEISDVICREIADIFNVERVVIKSFTDASQENHFFAEFIKDENCTGIKSYFPSANMIINDYWHNLFSNDYRPVVIDNLSKWDVLPEMKEMYKSIGIKSLICIPLKSGNNKWGGISLSNYRNYKKWSPSEVKLLETISQTISLAIREANLYNQAQFLANVSHEIKTPISSIKGFTSSILMEDHDLKGKTVKSLKQIQNNVDRVSNIINNLLYISEIEEDIQKGNLTIEELDIGELIESTIIYCREKAQEKNITLKYSGTGSVTTKVNIMLFQQAITNLIDNAIRYSPDNTRIELSLNRDDSNIIITVQDQGIGIPEEHLPNIFKRFYRVDKSRSRKTGGSGLGLSIVKLIIEAHRGQIFVQSKVNNGTTFKIILPL